MPIKSNITDPRDGKTAFVNNANGLEENSLVVATRELKTYENKIKSFTNLTYGAEMNVNVSYGGTPDKIHNGVDDALWTALAISGTWDFASATQSHAGSASIDGTSTVDNNTANFAKGGELTLANYTAVTGWIYLTLWDDRGTKQINIYGWDADTGTQQGNALNIADYININTLNSWQKFSIALGDFGIGAATIDSFRITTVDLGPGVAPDYYIDDLQVEETGSPAKFVIQPEKGTWMHVKSIHVMMADAYAGTLADATMPNIPYNSLLGVAALSTGITYRRRNGGVIVNSASIKQFSDLMFFSNSQVTGCGSDGTNTWVVVNITFSDSIILKSEEEDEMSLTINDDMSGLLLFRVGVGSKIEYRN